MNRRSILPTHVVGPLAVLIAAASLVFATASPARGQSVEPASIPRSSTSAPHPCTDPHPCGTADWPHAADARFELGDVEHLFIEMSDGVLIEGWIARPAVTGPLPTIVYSSPYFSICWTTPARGGPYCSGGPGDSGWWADPPSVGPPGFELDLVSGMVGIPPIRLVQRGFALAHFAVRGTAASGGCFNTMSAREQADQAELVDWVGQQDWSNGRVGTAGLSYDSATAWAAAVEAPPSLKTVVTTGVMTDLYGFYSSPQGAVDVYINSLWPESFFEMSQYPNPFHPEALGDRIRPQIERQCAETAEALATHTTLNVAIDRNAEHWAERRIADRLGDVTAAALVLHGFEDINAHGYQEDHLWASLNGPKRQVEGHWGHDWPSRPAATPGEEYPGAPWSYSFEQMLYDWYDYWLKGVGPVPDGLGTVDYEDTSGEWRRTSQWPAAGVDESLHLQAEGLAGIGLARSPHASPTAATYASGASPVDYAVRFDGSAPIDEGQPDAFWWAALCPDHAASPTKDLVEGPTKDLEGMVVGPGLVYATAQAHDAVTVAGNPHVWLNLESTAPTGIVDVRLVDIGPGFACTDDGIPQDISLVARAAADLRFHHGGFEAIPFPVGEVTGVRIDFHSIAATIEPDHRLALVASAGNGPTRYNSTHQPNLTIHAGPVAEGPVSHVVLRIAEGTFSSSDS